MTDEAVIDVAPVEDVMVEAESAVVAGASPGSAESAIRRLQTTVGNAATGGLIQRHLTGDAHPHRFRQMPVGYDILALMEETASIVRLVRSMRPDQNLVLADQVPDLSRLSMVTVWAEDQRLFLDADGTPWALTPGEMNWSASVPVVMLADPATRRLWRIGSMYHPGEQPQRGRIDADPLTDRLTPLPEGQDPGAPYLIVLMPNARFDSNPGLVEEIQRRIAAAERARARAERLRRGPPAWARRRGRAAIDRRRRRRRERSEGTGEGGDGGDRGGPGGTDEGTGTGVRGTGTGGGGTAAEGVGTGDSGTGTGRLEGSDETGRGAGGTAPEPGEEPGSGQGGGGRAPEEGETPGAGSGATPADRTQSGSGQTEPTEADEPGTGEGGAGDDGGEGGGEPPAPMSEEERRERVSVELVMTPDGHPALQVDVDGAVGTVRMRRGETDEELDRRLAELEEELAESRDPNQSVRVQGGATETEIGATGPVGAAAGQTVSADRARELTGRAGGGGGAPGEILPGAGRANTPAWPATLQLYGIDMRSPVTVVTGATNQASMDLDRGPDVLDYFQQISYTWELIEVTGMQVEDRARASASTGVGAGEVVGPGAGQGRDIAREQEYIREDIEAEHWAVRAAAFQLIGLSAAIRTLGSLISSLVSILTEPRNERSIPWGRKGEFILRAVATPIPSDEALAAPDDHIIRASSVRCIPVRVVDVNERATEVNDAEHDRLADLRSQLEAAEKEDPDSADARLLRAQIAQLEGRMQMGAVARIGATIDDLEREIRWCEILTEEPARNLEFRLRAELKERRGLSDDDYAELIEYQLGLHWQGIRPAERLRALRTSRDALRTQHSTARRWSREIERDHRPNVTLVSEENGQVYQLLSMLGEARDSRPDQNRHHWIFYDITSDKTQRRYHGHSTRAGEEGRNEAIRNAFVDFRENAEYGRGTIAIRMPDELSDVPIDPRMRAAPGATARWMRRLEDLATACEIAALVLATVVTGGGAAAMIVGGVGALAGAAVAYHRMSGRREGDRLRLDYDTFMDILAIVGAVMAVMPVFTGAVRAIARNAARAARSSGNVVRVLRASRWAQRAEIVDRGLHIFGLVQGVGQTVIQVPYDVIRQFAELEESEGMSEGEKRARRAMILLNGIRSGAISIIGLAQSLGEPMPGVTSDAEIWSRAAEAAGPAPEPGAGGQPPVSEGGAPRTQPPDAPLEVDPPDVSRAADDARAGTTEPAPTPHSDERERGADTDEASEDAPTVAPVAVPTVPSSPAAPPRTLDARGLVAAARRVIFADRAVAPPVGEITVHPSADFAAATGHGVDVLAVVEPGTGRIRINGDVLDATPGLAASLERLIIARGHPTGRRALGDVAGRAFLRQVIRNVFGNHPGLPAGADSPMGRQLVLELSRAVGSQALADTYFQGAIGEVRDRLRERFGHGRSEAILDAVRAGSLGELVRLLQPDPGALRTTFGDRFADAVADAVSAQERPRRRRSSEQQLAAELADAIGSQPLRDAHHSGDMTELGNRLRDHFDGDAASVDAFTDAVRAGDVATARRLLADAAGAPTEVPAAASGAAGRFVESLAAATPDVAAGVDLLRSLGSMQLARDLVESGAFGGSERAALARERIQAARMAIIDSVIARVKRTIAAEFPGVRLRDVDHGSQGIGSDRDVTLSAGPADPASAPPLADLVRASTAAVREAYELLRQQGLEPDQALDSNFYTDLHEQAVTPASEGERRAISSDQTVVSLIEIALSAPGELAAVREAQLAAIDSSGAPPAIREQMRARVERQFAQAERRAAEIGAGDRSVALEAARRRLEDALQRTPPAGARERRQLMAEVKLLEPDAYGSRAAVEGVVHGQQAMRRATTPEARQAAGRHVGTAGRGEGTLTERLEHRLQQARAALGHLLAHVPRRGQARPRDVVAVAKQLARLTHAFRESGLFIDHPLLDDAGDVVASKAENDPDAIVREVRVWAERTGQRFGSDQAMLDAYVREARRLGLEMSSRMGASVEAVREVEGPVGDDGPTAPPAARTDAVPGEMSADRPVPGERRPDGSAVDADGAAAARAADAEALAPHEIAHEALLDELRAGMHEPIPAATGRRRPIRAGEVGRTPNASAAHRMFRDAVARAGGREVGLFFERSSGTYAVVVGREASVSPPRNGGPWECPLHTHPNPENVLTYRMPAPHDVFGYWQAAMRTGRRAVGFIEYPKPDGTRGLSRLEVDPDGNVTFEYPDQQEPETLHFRDYQDRWDSRTRYVEPGSPQHRRFLQDMADADRSQREDAFSADRTVPPDAGAETAEPSSESAETSSRSGTGSAGATGSAPAPRHHAEVRRALADTFGREMPSPDDFVQALTLDEYVETWRGDDPARAGKDPPGPAYFDRTTRRIYMDNGVQPATVAHEALHAMTHQGFFDAIPDWLNEGITELLTAEAIGRIAADTDYRDNIGLAIALRDLVGIDLIRAAYFDGEVDALARALDAATGSDDTLQALRNLLPSSGTARADPDLLGAARRLLAGAAVGSSAE